MGFREGMEEGKEISLQSSFNYGFKRGFSLAISLNYLNNVLLFVLEKKIKVEENDFKECEKLKKKIEEYWLEIKTNDQRHLENKFVELSKEAEEILEKLKKENHLVKKICEIYKK